MLEILSQSIINNLSPGIPAAYLTAKNKYARKLDTDSKTTPRFEEFQSSPDQILQQYRHNAKNQFADYSTLAENSQLKLLIENICLQLRKKYASVINTQKFIDLKIKGKYKNDVLAFAWTDNQQHLMVILPNKIPADGNWKDTRVILPRFSTDQWQNYITHDKVKTSEGMIGLTDISATFPSGFFEGIPGEGCRQAGVLLHISSLPGKWGVGDFGKEAYRFIDFLHCGHQAFWQMLPLNMTSKLTEHSPYSALSAFACNTLFLDAEALVKHGLLDKKILRNISARNGHKANYEKAYKYKNRIIDLAFDNYQKLLPETIKNRYEKFQLDEQAWLDDFALFFVLKWSMDDLPWNQWPETFRDRHKQKLQEFASHNQYEIEKCKFAQFLMAEQWKQLKTYAHGQRVQLFGDIPFYVSYDSADVWAHPDLFLLNDDKSMKVVAGVPPDYFNANGQLWGMPIFDWDKMKTDGYSWWMTRIRKNIEWFDLLRIDHFRAFEAYWEVPHQHKTAINGSWITGPGVDFFRVLQQHFPEMPFVAEDLGKITHEVYELRDAFGLPGMKVIQFAFGEPIPLSQHLPNNHTYNSIAYTGTHDNNTLLGWLNTEVDSETKKRIQQYTGSKINKRKIVDTFIRLAYTSVAKITIVPMQDWLSLDERHRMNYPSTTRGNWLWRIRKRQLRKKLAKRMSHFVETCKRF